MSHLRRAATGALVLSLACLSGCDRGRRSAPPPAANATPPPPPAQRGMASYYGPEFAGRPTASGEPHDPEDLTAASRSLPLGATARVTDTETGRSVTVEVNDRGPYAKGRIIDLSRKAAERLGIKKKGVAPVKVQPTRPAGAEP